MQLPEARDFLVEHVGADVSEVEYVGEGAWSRCFGYALGGNEYVVRFGRHVEDFERDRWASRFASRGLRVPQVVEIGEAFGAWYAISTRAHGAPLEQLDADARPVLATRACDLGVVRDDFRHHLHPDRR